MNPVAAPAARDERLERVCERAPLAEYARATGLRVLVIGASKDPNAKVTVLLVSPKTGDAEAVVKAPTTDVAAAAVEKERRVLLELERLDIGDAGTPIPRVIDTVDFEGRPALVTSAVGGAPMSTSYLAWLHTARRARVEADFAAVDEWLSQFQRRTTAAAPAPGADVAARLVGRFGSEPDLDDIAGEVAGAENRLGRDAVSAAGVHGDLWLGNVLATDARVTGVVDWEAGSAAGDPRLDVVRFANMYALYLDHAKVVGGRVLGHRGLRAGRFGAGLEFALDGNGWFPELYREFIARGIERLGGSRRSWRDAALLGIAEVAASTDDSGFARRHLELFRRLCRGGRA